MAYYGFCKNFKPGDLPEHAKENAGFDDWPAVICEKIRDVTLEYLQEYGALHGSNNEVRVKADKEEGRNEIPGKLEHSQGP